MALCETLQKATPEEDGEVAYYTPYTQPESDAAECRVPMKDCLQKKGQNI